MQDDRSARSSATTRETEQDPYPSAPVRTYEQAGRCFRARLHLEAFGTFDEQTRKLDSHFPRAASSRSLPGPSSLPYHIAREPYRFVGGPVVSQFALLG